MTNKSDIAVSVRGLSKAYTIAHNAANHTTAGEALMHKMRNPFERAERETFWALKDVSFDIQKGDVVGIIGRNGAGKSTLLKVLSRITEPTRGKAILNGRVGSLLEVGTGFHPELTGRENIYMNGAILGMSKREIAKHFDAIVDFAEVENFLDTPVKRYSSGMYVRLAFAVAAHLNPEILIVDEVLAVGDAEFQKKCLGKMQDISRQEGRTILFVSHNMAAVQNLCELGILLEAGQVKYIGSEAEAVRQYTMASEIKSYSLCDRKDRVGSGEVRITKIELRNHYGDPVDTVASGQDIDVYMYFEKADGYQNRSLSVHLMVKTQMDIPVFVHHNRLMKEDFGTLPASGAFVCRLYQLPLPPSIYNIRYSILSGTDYIDCLDNAGEITVAAGNFFSSTELPAATHGLCLVNANWRLVNDRAMTLEPAVYG